MERTTHEKIQTQQTESTIQVKSNAQEKLACLKQRLKELGRVAIAFSSGVDSAFLLKAAHEVLGNRAVAVTVHTSFFPKRELEEAELFCRQYGITQYTVPCEVLKLEGIAQNPKNRCYLCKRSLFEAMLDLAAQHNLGTLAEGSNLDDESDYRPGMQAIKELGVISPLREAFLTKEDIRTLSHTMGLSTWDKPSFACLASRFAYGETITEEKLDMVEQAEQLLISLGFRQMRVRIHGKMARIEIEPKDFVRLMQEDVRELVVKKLQAYGFTYVAMDLKGFRSGSMNETLS